MRFRFSLLLLLAPVFLACNDGGKQAGTVAKEPKPAPKTDLSAKQTDELLHTLAAYYTLKDAFVASNGAQADIAASKLLSAADLLKNELGGAPQAEQMLPIVKNIMVGCDSILARKADSLEAKRAVFAGISDAMLRTLRAANLKNGGVYQQFCPMAFDNKGGYWLSAEEEIRNPYFGKMMLECGEVKDSL